MGVANRSARVRGAGGAAGGAAANAARCAAHGTGAPLNMRWMDA